MFNIDATVPCDAQPVPNRDFLRNTGFALLAFTLAAEAISVAGVLKTSEPLIMAQPEESAAPADNSILQQIERNIFQREMLEVHYVNRKRL